MIQEAIDGLIGNKTVLIIAHKPRSMIACNEIAVLSEGKLICSPRNGIVVLMDPQPCFGYDESMQVEGTPEETAVLVRWKKRTDNYVLVRTKAEAILCASRGVDVGIIAEMVGRSEKTTCEWLA